jgi:hypothetical protein
MTGPFVLVGHRGGGPIIRVAATRRPGWRASSSSTRPTSGCDRFFSNAPLVVDEVLRIVDQVRAASS